MGFKTERGVVGVVIDFDKMTKEEHEQYREMVRKAEGYNEILNIQKRAEAEVWETDEWEDEIERVIGEYESGDSEC